MKLVVDVGNSRIKWARVVDGRLEAGAPVDRGGDVPPALDAAWSTLQTPSAVLISSVADADSDARMEQWMEGRWGRSPQWFRSRPETLGLINGYGDPAQLGSDRWAALLGARARRPGPLGIIDCGTAVTLDVVDAQDRHLGGLIAAGPELAQRSLLTDTAKIRDIPARGTGLLGRSTAQCVANGTILGLAGALERWVWDVDDALKGVAWLATGGAWTQLEPMMRISVHYDPHLVLRGLARVLE